MWFLQLQRVSKKTLSYNKLYIKKYFRAKWQFNCCVIVNTRPNYYRNSFSSPTNFEIPIIYWIDGILLYVHSATSPDFYGRIETPHCYTASNAFKLDAWHALVIFREHHPLRWTEEALMDVFNTAMKWLVLSASLDLAVK